MNKAIATLFGTALISSLMISASLAEVKTLELNRETPDGRGSLEYQGVKAILEDIKRINEYGQIDHLPMLTVEAGDEEIKVAGESNFFPYSMVQIAEMDDSNDFPEVIFSSYTGGAHCCSMVKIVTHNPDSSSWQVVDVGYFDGGLMEVSDPDQSGNYKYVTSDNRFLYKFSSYAGSYPPIQVLQLKGLEMQDISRERRFFPLHRERLQDMWRSIDQAGKEGYEVNGVLAGYVATKAILGEAIPAWELMLKRYGSDSDWDLSECRGEYDDQGECQGDWITYDSFPEALRAFLLETGYLSAEDVAP